ncbi:MAG: translocation/assembly module TamB, partial [Bacteroidales bacterium]|nr:translocation/assembly module TamB [Bacteroidales bacterium]
LILNAAIKRVNYGGAKINDFEMDVNSDGNGFNYKISSVSVSISEIQLDNILIEGKLEDETIFANISSNNEKQDRKFLIKSQIKKHEGNYRLTIDPEDFFLLNKQWDLAAAHYIDIGKQGFLIHRFLIKNSDSQINVASLHDQFNDDLNVSIRNFRLDDFSLLMEKDSTMVKGNADGNILLRRIGETYGLIADAEITDLFVYDNPVGNLTLKTEFAEAGKIEIEGILSGTENNLIAKGNYIPGGGDNTISIDLAIESLAMKTVEAFSLGQLKETSGMILGNLSIQGKFSAPEVTGELGFSKVSFNPAFLNSRLDLKDGTIQFNKDEIIFNSLTLLDMYRHTAIIDGTIQVEKFKNIIFDLIVNTNDFLLFNTTAKDNKEFYGRMIIDSKIDINGPMAMPVIDARLKIKEGSNFTFAVPEGRLTTDKGEDVVEFTDSRVIDPIMRRSEEKDVQIELFKGLDISSVIEIDKQATLKLIMDPASTDSLVVKGEAALSFSLDRSGKLSITGMYILGEGSYQVTLQSVAKRKFDIVPGSTITWNGEPTEAEISINAVYSVRASPYDLVAGQMTALSEADRGVYKNRYPFLVFLKLRGAILNPQMSFEIQLPPEEKGILGGVVNQKLNLLNEDESALNKQVFALLVLGRFIQENPLETESGGASSLVRSTVGSILSSELNNFSSKIFPGMDLNFEIQSYNDYQTGQAEGRTQVEIGFKKQLFNERLSIQLGGTMDVEGEKARQNTANDITGDATVEYKLTKDGRLRLKAFRHNQYEGVIEGQLVETGAGVLFVRDFNMWKELFKRPKKTKAPLKTK